MLKRLPRYERQGQPVASRRQFLERIALNLAAAVLVIGISLLIGMAGYVYFEGMNGIDAYLNASMILAGMGPVGTMQTTGGKLFAGTYALYSGIVLIFSTGIILSPVVHRILHDFHVDDDKNDASPRRQR